MKIFKTNLKISFFILLVIQINSAKGIICENKSFWKNNDYICPSEIKPICDIIIKSLQKSDYKKLLKHSVSMKHFEAFKTSFDGNIV